ncbi:glycosyltransferase family 61 protein [Trematosphaeria pertusa]|uniref:EGF domain-specific O-linked N-acetylglucosamine transferase n=1 Tax=Trematosphaeria pertusa TaxID=390896 RepID=A0A6A6ILP6_9PLEO|nr:glycosyltransferase family 61 protein [Trematosphaeria pertusa]KAF2251139.1 glycosyltransferase family 61 protein [Trematosphaeria pertusa]
MLVSSLGSSRLRWLYALLCVGLLYVTLSWLYTGHAYVLPSGDPDSERFEGATWQERLGKQKDRIASTLKTWLPKPHNSTEPLPPLPSDYDYERAQPEFCQKRFGLDYLYDLRDTATQYCTDDSSSPMTCFRSRLHFPLRTDTFCVAKNAHFNAGEKKVELGCKQRQFSEEEKAANVPTVDEFCDYNNWMGVGPWYIFNETITLLNDSKSAAGRLPSASPGGRAKHKFTILIKRDWPLNLWHFTVDLISMVLSLDVLQMTIDPATEEPFFQPDDEENTQIIILDGREDGPFLDAWNKFARLPIRRIEHISADEDLGTIIVPLPGVSNPMWYGCWRYHNCQQAWHWLRTFRNRMLQRYGLIDSVREMKPYAENPEEPSQMFPDWNEKIVVTVIRRKGSRQLVNQQECIDALKKAFPDIQVNVYDFAQLDFAAQLNVTHNTNVLVGVHGAGMMHTIYLRPGSAVVEIQPQSNTFQGHRNFARGLELEYYMTHGKDAKTEEELREEEEAERAGKDERSVAVAGGLQKRYDWQTNNVMVEPDRFVRLVGAAIYAVYGKRDDTEDVM